MHPVDSSLCSDGGESPVLFTSVALAPPHCSPAWRRCQLQEQGLGGTHDTASTAKKQRQESVLGLGWVSPRDMAPDPPTPAPNRNGPSHVNGYDQYNP